MKLIFEIGIKPQADPMPECDVPVADIDDKYKEKRSLASQCFRNGNKHYTKLSRRHSG